MSRWSQVEEAYLDANEGSMTQAEMADALDRTPGAVATRIQERNRRRAAASRGEAPPPPRPTSAQAYPSKPQGYDPETLAWAVGNLPPPGVFYEQATTCQREAAAIVVHHNDWKRWKKANAR